MLTSEHSCVDERRTMTSGSREGLDVRFEELLSRCQTKMADQGFGLFVPLSNRQTSSANCVTDVSALPSPGCVFMYLNVVVFLMFCCYLM